MPVMRLNITCMICKLARSMTVITYKRQPGHGSELLMIWNFRASPRDAKMEYLQLSASYIRMPSKTKSTYSRNPKIITF